MKKLILLFLVLFLNVPLFSQNVKNLKLSHQLKSHVENNTFPKRFTTVADTIKVVAIMVQFQQDNTSFTTGDGRFDLSNKYYNPTLQRDTVVDSPPYDSLYFIDHLEFLKNYYYKSSKGKLIINYELKGKVITLPKKMQEYSPQRNENNLKLGQFFTDAWSSADSVIDFSQYDQSKTAFVIFHAGAGKDIDLTSIFGFDPTPYDIPSIYLGLKSLKEVFGNSYEGFQANHGFKITNSMIIPSTELREIESVGQITLLRLGMNGILTGNFGSYLGLPDLFNTQTGTTAIGRFGLMDGQSFFSYMGIFPPEPSAWEKIYLGWIQPVTLSYGEGLFNLKSSSTDEFKDSTVYKVLISSKEYFLIENRNRNPFNSGQKVYLRNRAFRDSTLFTKDAAGFYSSDISSIKGNLYNVSYLDWSLPGSIDDTSNYRGGILIWHIDENVIDANFSSNTINNDLRHRGVAVMEAKGSQDIGVSYNTPFGTFISEGSFVDYWYNGYHFVPSTIYQNKFTPASTPNSLSYSLANNNIFVTDFDSISYVMKLRIKIGSDVISPIPGYPKYLGSSSVNEYSQVIPIDINRNGKEALFVNNGQNIYAFNNNGTGITSTSGLLFSGYGSFPVMYGYYGYLNDFRIGGVQNNTTGSSLVTFKLNSGIISDTNITTFAKKITAAPIILDSSKIALGFENGYVIEKLLSANQLVYKDTTFKTAITRFTRDNQQNYRYSYSPVTNILAGNFLLSNSTDSLQLFNTGEVRINGTKININYSDTYRNVIACDINKDNRQEIIFSNGNQLYAVNSNGILLDNFPVKLSSAVTSGFSVCDMNDDGNFAIIFVTANGDLYAVGTNGRTLNGFPYKIGPNTYSTPALYNYSDTLAISVISSDGYLYSFKTNHLFKSQNILWKNYLRDKDFSNNNFRGIYSPPVYSEKLPKDKVYNWPNPVYDGRTFIRYYINGTAGAVTIKILDLSGELVTKLNGTSYSNAENEVIWDASKVQSGVYYGVVEATVDGSSETKIIKIAVVK